MNPMTRRGFTLMEMLLVCALVSLISVSIFNAFNNGLKLWKYGAQLTNEQNAAMAFDRIGQDLRSTVPVSMSSFEGSSSRMSFPAIVLTPADRNGSRAPEGLIDQIGAVQYRFDDAEGKIYRSQANYGQSLKKQWGPPEEVAAGLEDVKFMYDMGGGHEGDLKESPGGKVPAGVLMQAHVQGQDPEHVLKRYYNIPVGG